jgi:hypothetical protein
VIVILSPRLTEVGKRQSTRGVTYYMTDLKFSIMVSDSPVRISSTQTKKAKRSSFKNFVTKGCSTFLVRKPTKSHLPRKDNLYKSCRHTRRHVSKVLRSNYRGFSQKMHSSEDEIHMLVSPPEELPVPVPLSPLVVP